MFRRSLIYGCHEWPSGHNCHCAIFSAGSDTHQHWDKYGRTQRPHNRLPNPDKRVANNSKDPLSFLSDFRDEIKAVVSQVRISGISDPQRVRETAQKTVDELFSLMKPPSTD
jgi:hypothetical protein